ncbi:hypothetical protein Sme01_08930 [Sphaerisporangium melleum]|uniref:Lipoprotein n=1 Tax=Sphaerisporangium melleum TaxID=321316 RepID=A0A917VG59_9ACTN|nr:hypothetical protein [Sphaerisporangium melleum]GGK71769.1 hypothetical protein GCM10007964_13260 [Sphaerisporangium melleum]GII68417.1 hypothetical protein Sme01_08930 [Sphaerisporangium melleum]
MTQKSSSLNLRRKLAIIVLLIPFALTSCTADKDPTAAQVGQTLKGHVLQLLQERMAIDVKITDPGGKDISCGDGRVKQTFAATGRDSAGSDDPEALNALLVGAMSRVADYKVVSVGSPGKPVRVANSATRTTLIFSSPGRSLYVVSGETDCLPA